MRFELKDSIEELGLWRIEQKIISFCEMAMLVRRVATES